MIASEVGVVGLGFLGTALAERLIGAGHAVRCYNRTRQKADPLIARGASWSDNPFQTCNTVIVSLYRADTVRSVLDRLSDGFRAGQTIIDTTTVGPDDAPRIGEWLASAGVDYVEAPIAASSEQTRRGEAVAFLGGDTAVIDRVQPVLSALTKAAHHVGPWGAAAKFKLVNNLILGLNRAALAEGLAFAESLGLDLGRTLTVLRTCNAYSGVMDTKGEKMVRGEFSPQARLAQHSKDVRIILSEASNRGQHLPLSKQHLELLEQAEAAGLGDLDNSAIMRVIAESAVEEATP